MIKMTTITCTKCGTEIELSEALTKDIEKTVVEGERRKHAAELAKARIEVADLAKKKFEAEFAAEQRKAAAAQELEIKTLQSEAASEKETSKELREQLSDLMKELREERKAKENAELEMQKKLMVEENKIREEITKSADEKYRLKLEEGEKRLRDTQKALDEAQRKAAQGSQQLQGEILELDVENILKDAFHDDEIQPIAKGQKGSDIRQVVTSQGGMECGVILWEIKRTKNWTDGWIQTIKENLLLAKANIPIIVTNVMPKDTISDIRFVDSVLLCKPSSVVILATLLRKSLLDVSLQKALTKDRGTKADTLFSFVISHEFVHQIEAMAEIYSEMTAQVQRERTAYERFWAQREGQAKKLLMGTANIIGGIQGRIGSMAMPRIKGLDLFESGQDETKTE